MWLLLWRAQWGQFLDVGYHEPSQSLFSVALGTLTLLCRCLCSVTPGGPLFSHPHQNQRVESRDQQRFLLFFLDSLSFCFVGFKVRRTYSRVPLTVPQRRGRGEPNTDWAQTLKITLLPLSRLCPSYSQKAGNLAESTTSDAASPQKRKV